MKVSELIKLLQEAPQDLQVMISGYEGGLDDITRAVVDYVDLNVNIEWYYGPHELKSKHEVKDSERPNALIFKTTRNERKFQSESD